MSAKHGWLVMWRKNGKTPWWVDAVCYKPYPKATDREKELLVKGYDTKVASVHLDEEPSAWFGNNSKDKMWYLIIWAHYGQGHENDKWTFDGVAYSSLKAAGWVAKSQFLKEKQTKVRILVTNGYTSYQVLWSEVRQFVA